MTVRLIYSLLSLRQPYKLYYTELLVVWTIRLIWSKIDVMELLQSSWKHSRSMFAAKSPSNRFCQKSRPIISEPHRRDFRISEPHRREFRIYEPHGLGAMKVGCKSPHVQENQCGLTWLSHMTYCCATEYFYSAPLVLILLKHEPHGSYRSEV